MYSIRRTSEIKKHTFFIIVIKSWEVQFSNCFLLMQIKFRCVNLIVKVKEHNSQLNNTHMPLGSLVKFLVHVHNTTHTSIVRPTSHTSQES
jgi:hypothetical protein